MSSPVPASCQLVTHTDREGSRGCCPPGTAPPPAAKTAARAPVLAPTAVESCSRKVLVPQFQGIHFLLGCDPAVHESLRILRRSQGAMGLPRRFQSFLDRLYMLQRFKLLLGSRVFPSSVAVPPQHLRRQLVAQVRAQRDHSSGAPVTADSASAHLRAALWTLDVRESAIPAAGLGVFLRGESVPPNTLMTLYPGKCPLQCFLNAL